VARVLQEWSSVSRIFHHPTRPQLDELELSRTLMLAAAALGDHDELIMRSPRSSRVIPTGNAWPPWQSWANVSRSYLRYNALPWSMLPHGGSRSRTAAKSLRMLYLR
jgi:hypothetical protein